MADLKPPSQNLHQKFSLNFIPCGSWFHVSSPLTSISSSFQPKITAVNIVLVFSYFFFLLLFLQLSPLSPQALILHQESSGMELHTQPLSRKETQKLGPGDKEAENVGEAISVYKVLSFLLFSSHDEILTY